MTTTTTTKIHRKWPRTEALIDPSLIEQQCAVGGAYRGGVVEHPHAVRLDEGLPALLDVGDVAEAGQQALADQHVAVARVVAVPVVVRQKQGGHVPPVHRPPRVALYAPAQI